MKISVLTFSKETNFGANLQCYALCKTLQDMGHKVDIIDIQLKRYPMPWYSAILRLPMIYLFNKFRKQHLNLFTRHFKDVEDLRRNCPQSDLYIVGSDQVWNPKISKRLDPLVYFFSFLPENAHRISYAASFGTSTWNNPELTSEVNLLLRKFDAISVREKAGAEICEQLFNVEAKIVVDPTLLLSSYDQICGKYNSACETNDLTYYTFVHDTSTQKILAEFAQEYSLNAVVLRNNHMYPGFKRKMYVSVSEWLNSIRYSKIVVTTSFHCMVFCILFHKRFVVVPGKKDAISRHLNLLYQTNLTDLFCPEPKDLLQKLEFVCNLEINYSEVEEKLKLLRIDSMNFLKNIVERPN